MKYVRITRRILSVLGVRLREGALMVSLLVFYAAMEGFGIGLLLPVLQYLEAGGEGMPEGGVWPYLLALSAALRLRITLGLLLTLAFLPILARQFVFFLNTWVNARVQNRATERLTSRIFRALVNSDLSYIESQQQGRLLSFLTTQVGRCGLALTQYLRLLGAVAVVAVYLVVLSVLSWQLTAIAVAAMAFITLAMRGILKQSRSYGSELSEVTLKSSQFMRERLNAMRLIKMRGREEEETQELSRLVGALREVNTKITVAGARVEVIVDPALMLAVFMIIFAGVRAFDMTLSSLGLFLFVLLRLNGKTKELNVGRHTLASLMPSFDFVELALEEAESARTVSSGRRPYSGLLHSIQLDDVRFSYAEGPEVLKGVSLTIPRGSLTALVGRSGAGKSTLVDMIPLLRHPSSGTITFDGFVAEEFDRASLRRSIGFLTQEPILFSDTILENLVYGLDRDVSPEEIDRALRESHCTEFVEQLPDRLNTNVGDRGVRLSGGQRQRLALARVFLQNPDILILDEPTSALDSESEHYIQQAFERIAEDRTVIVIAHRLSTVERANQIVVLADGAIVERGTHRELLEHDGEYRRLFEQQIRA